MKTATIQELKQELQSVSQSKLLELCLRLAKFKKENKELLTFLLFESNDEESYTAGVRSLIEEGFSELPKTTHYLTKKSLRKILRITNRYIKYAGSKQVEVALLIYFCQQMKALNMHLPKTTVLQNIYLQQLKKINAALELLHEDLQYDYKRELDALEPEETSFVGRIFGKRRPS